MTKRIEYDCECIECNGTGLYVGYAEGDGAAIVCYMCGGTGKREVKTRYSPFIKRKQRKNIKRVFQANPGIGIGKSDLYTLSDFGGMSIEDWINGKRFTLGTEMRKFTCPAWWYQTINSDYKPEWDSCNSCNTFSKCKMFNNKQTCWDRFDKEHEEDFEK